MSLVSMASVSTNNTQRTHTRKWDEPWFPEKMQSFPPPNEDEFAFPVNGHLVFQMGYLNKKLNLKRWKSLVEYVHKMQNLSRFSLIPVSQTLWRFSLPKRTELNWIQPMSLRGVLLFFLYTFAGKSHISWAQWCGLGLSPHVSSALSGLTPRVNVTVFGYGQSVLHRKL